VRFEPVDALVATPSGLADLAEIINGAPSHLQAGGWLLVEHGFEQGDAVRQLFAGAGFDDIETHHDLAGLPRMTEGHI
jgi:release factor glutamine methyltransferase